MLGVQLIGVGAAGNKGTIAAINEEIISAKDCILINTNRGDVPVCKEEVKYISLGENDLTGLGGCAKDPATGERLCIAALQSKRLDLDNLIFPTTKVVFVLCSTDGGTGSGAGKVIAAYINNVIGIKTILVGFEGIGIGKVEFSNTIRWFKGLDPKLTVQCISNAKFSSECNGNKEKIERAANKEFAVRLSILMGNAIRNSDNNIDESDLFKSISLPGLSTTEYFELNDKLKNKEQFNQILSTMVDNSKSIDTSKGRGMRFAVIMNIPEDERDGIDMSYTALREKYGIPDDIDDHVQYDSEMSRFIAIIIVGMPLPIEEVERLYKKWLDEQEKQAAIKESDFFGTISSYEVQDNREGFNQASVNENDFFKSFGASAPAPVQQPVAKSQEEKNKKF